MNNLTDIAPESKTNKIINIYIGWIEYVKCRVWSENRGRIPVP